MQVCAGTRRVQGHTAAVTCRTTYVQQAVVCCGGTDAAVLWLCSFPPVQA
jgi:hypothetical protein